MSATRITFLATLRAGLRGAPAEVVEEIIVDYAAHFEAGAAANRTDEDIAHALGDPLALADELRAELRIEKWDKDHSARSALNVLGSVFALGVLNTALIFIAAPLLFLFGFVMLVTAAAFFAFAMAVPFVHLSIALPGGVVAKVLLMIGSVAVAASLLAITLLCGIALINGVGRYARLHYRVLERNFQKVTS